MSGYDAPDPDAMARLRYAKNNREGIAAARKRLADERAKRTAGESFDGEAIEADVEYLFEAQRATDTKAAP